MLMSFSVEAQYVQGDEVDSVTQNKEQNKKKKNIPNDRYVLGGNIGAQFGTETYIELSPQIGYFFNKNLMAGLRITYIYYNYKVVNYATSIYGAGVFGRYYFIEELFAQAGYEFLNLGQYNTENRITVGNILTGLGISLPIGPHADFTIVGLWSFNFNETAQTPYQNPILRAGVSFGL